MGIYRHFPYSNFHEMNLDEIIKIVKELAEEWATYHAEWDAWMEEINDDWDEYQRVMNEAWENMRSYITNYFDTLDVQIEINNKITSMVNSGEFGDIVAPYIPASVTTWLEANITEPVGVIIDKSLSISGACADAKVTGDTLEGLAENNIYVINKTVTWQSGYVPANGTIIGSSLSQMALITLLKGETVHIGTRNTSTGIISTTTADTISVGDTVTVLSTTSGTDQYESRSYTAPADMKIVVCVRASEYDIYFSKDTILAEEEDISNLRKGYQVTNILPTAYIGVFGYIAGTHVAKGQPFNGDGIILDITNMTGKIRWGYDTNLSYPTQVIMGMEGTTLPSPYCMYYLKSDIDAGTAPTFAQRGFDLSNKDNGYIDIDLDKLKTALPTIQALVINEASGAYLLQTISEIKSKIAIVVDANGNGDFDNITDAVSSALEGDTILIKDGEYKETVIINKYIHLVGQSKQNTILYQDIGDYDNAPLLITQGTVCNMTIKSLAPIDTSSLTDYAYAIHLDKNFASLAKYQKCEIYNCDIYSEVNDAIGAGTNYASEYDIHDCFIHVAHNPVKALACGFKCHNGQYQTTGKVRLRNNIIITEDANGGSIYDILFHNGGISNTQPIEILMVGNVLKYYHNGITNIFVPSAYNFGNSVAGMNTL